MDKINNKPVIEKLDVLNIIEVQELHSIISNQHAELLPMFRIMIIIVNNLINNEPVIV